MYFKALGRPGGHGVIVTVGQEYIPGKQRGNSESNYSTGVFIQKPSLFWSHNLPSKLWFDF